jgi:hypothetical protein
MKQFSLNLDISGCGRVVYTIMLKLLPFLALLASLPLMYSGYSYAGVKSTEQDQLNRINAERSSHGLVGLRLSECMSRVAREHSYLQQQSATLYHNAERNSQVKATCGIEHWGWFDDGSAENVGRGGGTLATSNYVASGFLASPGHHANIDGTFTHVGVGSYKGSDGWLYVTQIFINCQVNCGLLEVADSQAPRADWSPPPPPLPPPPAPPIAAPSKAKSAPVLTPTNPPPAPPPVPASEPTEPTEKAGDAPSPGPSSASSAVGQAGRGSILAGVSHFVWAGVAVFIFGAMLVGLLVRQRSLRSISRPGQPAKNK